MTCSEKTDFFAVIEVTSSSMWQENLTTKENECAGMGWLKYVIVIREGVENEVEEYDVVGSLEPFREQAVDEMIGRRM